MNQMKISSLRGAMALAAAVLIAPAFAAVPAHPGGSTEHTDKAGKTVSSKPAPQVAHAEKKGGKPATKAVAAAQPVALKPGAPADFGKQAAPQDVVQVANWVSVTHNNGKRAFVLIDKKQAQLYVFDPQGKLKSRTPVLVGKAIGDKAMPGSGDKPLSQLKENEKTTPAGRFLAMRGKNMHGEDVLWIDYQQALAMHRLASVSAAEHRAERIASADASAHRISNGCVNVPPQFYDTVLKPTIVKLGAIIYVLPETMPPQQVFGSLDVTHPQLAQARPVAGTTRKVG
jgi:hypothetical protein